MNPQQFKKIAVLLKKVYAEMEQEALDNGVSIASPEFLAAVDKARELVLAKMGFTLEQYREIKGKVNAYTSADMMQEFEGVKKEVQQIKEIHIPTTEEISQIAHEVAKKYVTAPQVINKIVKEIKIQTPPQVIKETVVNKVEYDDKPLRKEIDTITEKVEQSSKNTYENLKKDFIEQTKEFITTKEAENIFGKLFKHNIDVLGMPDFRKLGMGLQDQIDHRIIGVNTHKITVSDTAPSNPSLYDIWIDIS